MKKIYAFILVAASLAIAACQPKELDDLKPDTPKESIKITATIEGIDSETKVNYTVLENNAGIKPIWEVDDQILVFTSYDNKALYKVSSVDDKGVATFEKVSESEGGFNPEEGADIYGVYYPNKGINDITNNGIEVDNISSQNGTLGKNTPAIMCAVSTYDGSTVDFSFKNKMAIIGVKKFQLEGSAQTHTVTSMTIEGITTTGKIAVNTDGELVLNPGTTGTVTATGSWETDESGFYDAGVYFIAIPTKDANITLSASDGTVDFNKISEIPVKTIEEGHYYYMSKKLGPEYVAQIGDKKYDTIADAFSKANVSESAVTVTLLADCAASGQLILDNSGSGKVTLDLNGKTLNCSTSNAYINVLNNRDFTITDNSNGNVAKQGTIKTSEANYVVRNYGGSLTIAGGNIRSTRDYYAIYTSGIATISGGKIYSTLIGVSVESGSLNISGGEIESEKESVKSLGTTTINGGKITSKTDVGVYLDDSNANLTISGGEITGNVRCVYNNKGTATINGGTFLATSKAQSGTSVVITNGASATTNITNGYFSSNSQTVELFTVLSDGTCNVTGGFFDRPINSNRTVKESTNYSNELNTDDTKDLYPFKVSNKTRYFNVVKEGGNTYWHNSSTSAAKQANAASVNTTITPRSNRTGLARITLNNPNHKITLDLNGKSISGQASARPFIDVQSEVEIINGTISSQDTATVRVLKGNLTIKNCIITSSLDKYTGTYFYNRGLVVNRGGNLEINESTIYASTINISLILSSGYSDDEKNNTIINGCTVISSAVGSSTSNTSSTAAVTQFTYGDTEIDGGYYYSNTTNGARVTINRASASGETSSVTATITINNGYFCNGADGGLCLRGNQLANIQGYTIKGGYFSSNPSTSYLVNNIRYYPTILGTVSEDQDHPWSQQVRVNGTDYTLSGNYKVTPTSD